MFLQKAPTFYLDKITSKKWQVEHNGTTSFYETRKEAKKFIDSFNYHVRLILTKVK